MGELGWMGIPFPEDVGGAGGTTLQYAIAVEELTRVDSSVAITMCAHASLGTQPVYLFGTDEQKARADAATSAAGGRLGAFGLTEPEAGSDAGNDADPRAPARAASGSSTAPSSSSPTPGPTSPGHVCITARDRRGARSAT